MTARAAVRLRPVSLFAVALAAAAAAEPGESTVATLGYALASTHPHRVDAFTQGLALHRGALYESVGGYGSSSLSRTPWPPGAGGPGGELAQRFALSARYFAEGLAPLGERVYLLTWRAGVGFVHDPDSLRRVGAFRYRGEGWGLASDGRRLVMSDGSAWLSIREPERFGEICRLRVTRDGEPVGWLNELEWVDGLIAANIWHSDEIAFIDPNSGRVRAALALGALRRRLPNRRLPNDRHGVLNGIAWDAHRRQLLVTGKNWPLLFALELSGLPERRSTRARLGCDRPGGVPRAPEP